jgi:hypothetical protein
LSARKVMSLLSRVRPTTESPRLPSVRLSPSAIPMAGTPTTRVAAAAAAAL